VALAALLVSAIAGCANGVGRNGDVVGGPCSATGGCAAGSTCLETTMYPGGTCSIVCTTQADCPNGTICVQESGGTCLLSCSSAGDCRDGYACLEKSLLPSGSALACIR
jgi:hypothetical protein